MPPTDITMVEGFRKEAIPKLEVFRPALGKQAIYPEDKHIAAVAPDVLCSESLPRPLEWLDLNASEIICDWLFGGQSHSC